MLCREYSGLHHAPLCPLDTLAQLPRITDEHAFVSFSHLKPSVVIVTTPSSPASSSSPSSPLLLPFSKEQQACPQNPSRCIPHIFTQLVTDYRLLSPSAYSVGWPSQPLSLTPTMNVLQLRKCVFFTNPAVSPRHCMLMRFANRRHC